MIHWDAMYCVLCLSFNSIKLDTVDNSVIIRDWRVLVDAMLHCFIFALVG